MYGTGEQHKNVGIIVDFGTGTKKDKTPRNSFLSRALILKTELLNKNLLWYKNKKIIKSRFFH